MLLLAVTIPLDLIQWDWWKRLNTVWEPWPRVIVNAFFTILWIGSIPASFYTCSDLCSAAGNGYGYITFASLQCVCADGSGVFDKRGVEQRTDRYQATEGLDILLA